MPASVMALKPFTCRLSGQDMFRTHIAPICMQEIALPWALHTHTWNALRRPGQLFHLLCGLAAKRLIRQDTSGKQIDWVDFWVAKGGGHLNGHL